MPRHLALCHLKAMAARFLILEASRGFEDTLEKSDAWCKLKLNLEYDINRHKPPDRNDDQRLDVFLQKILGLNLPHVPTDDPDIASAISLLHAQCSRINCETCAAEAKEAAPCNGSRRDPHIVAQAGHCIQPLKTAFDKTAKLAATIYHRAAGVTGVGAELATVFSRPLQLLGTPMPISGQVFWADMGDVRRSEVQLCIEVNSIDRGSLDMLPYTLAHEIFCHVYQLARGGPRDREPEQCCPFAEGWMDFVAALIVNGGPQRTEFTPWPEKEIGDKAMLTHRLRREKPSQAHTEPAHAYSKVRWGAYAAEQVLNLYDRHQLDAGVRRSAWEDFVDLSCLLNVSPAWTQPLRNSIERLAGRVGDNEMDALLKWRIERDKNATALDSVIAALAG